MRNTLIFLIAILLFACNNNEKTELDYEKDFAMYGLIINQLEYKSFSFEQQIEYHINQVKKEDEAYAKVKSIDSITNKYTRLIDKVSNELLGELSFENLNIPEQQQKLISAEVVNEYFFMINDLTDKGQILKNETESYKNQILNYFENEVYIKNVQSSFSLTDAQDRFGNRTEILNYLYRDTPLIAVLAQLKTMKANSLEIEHQLLLNITSCQQRI